MTKEQIENILGRSITDFEYTFFNEVMKTKEEGVQVIVHPARQSRSRLRAEADILKALIEKGECNERT
jgi:hypothetical protein